MSTYSGPGTEETDRKSLGPLSLQCGREMFSDPGWEAQNHPVPCIYTSLFPDPPRGESKQQAEPVPNGHISAYTHFPGLPHRCSWEKHASIAVPLFHLVHQCQLQYCPVSILLFECQFFLVCVWAPCCLPKTVLIYLLQLNKKNHLKRMIGFRKIYSSEN